MLIALLAGLIIGFVLAMPPGPIAVTAMRLGMDKGVKHGMAAALGTGLMDFIYCLTAIFATSAVLTIMDSIVDKHPVIMLAFQIVVIVSVILFGVIQLRSKGRPITNSKDEQVKQFKLSHKLSNKGPFLLGVAVALANAANPTFIPALAYITMNILNFGIIENTSANKFIFSLAFGIGNFAWLYVIVKVLVRFKDKMSPLFLARIHQFAGFTLISFGTILGYRVLTLTKWPEVLRLVFAF